MPGSGRGTVYRRGVLFPEHEGIRPVRTFPRTLGRRRLAAAALAAVTVGGLAVPVLDPALPWASASEGGKLKQKQKRVHQQVQQAGQDLEESSSQLNAAN